VRILLVEDEPLLGQQIANGLGEELHAVDLVSDGLTTMAYDSLLLDGFYDAVILDVMLPGTDGLSVCQRWRAQGVRTPILLLTARGSVEDRVLGLDVGADDYLTKPFAFVELLARLRALTRRDVGVRVEPLQVGDLTLDPVTHRVERAKQVIQLTAREYRILELLMRHNGQVLSRDQLATGAWDIAADHASNVVDVFIRNIRRKLDDPFATKLLHTVRGVGYTLRTQSDSTIAERLRPIPEKREPAP